MAGSIARMNSDDSYDHRMSLDSGYGDSKYFGGQQKVAEATKKMDELSLSDSKKHTITTPSDTECFEDIGNCSGTGDCLQNLKMPTTPSAIEEDEILENGSGIGQSNPNLESSNNNHPAMASTTQEESLDGEADCPIPVSAPVDTSRPYAAQGVRDNSSPVFGRGRGRGRGRGQARVTQPGQLPVTSPARDLGESPITELTVNDITKLAKYLDPDGCSIIKNWNHLALLLNIPEQERSALQRTYAGGGNPSLAFLLKLQTTHGSEPVSGLTEFCKKMQRNDVVKYLTSNVSGHTTIGQIPNSTLEVLAEKLADKRIAVIQCWKNLASYYRYSNQDIQSLASKIKEKNEYSPTMKLFEKIQGQYKDMTINALKSHLGNMNRYDVVRLLDTIMSEK